MHSNKKIAFDESKLVKSFQEHVRPLLDRFFDVIKPVYEEYLQINLLGEDRSLAFYEEVNIIFLKSFIFSMENPYVCTRLILNEGRFYSFERDLFVKSYKTMIYLDNAEDTGGLFNDRIMEMFFDSEIKKKLALREDKNFNVFKDQLRKFVQALRRPEIFEIFYLALQHAVRTGLMVENILNNKIMLVIAAKVDEQTGYSVFMEEEYLKHQERKLAAAFDEFSIEMKGKIPDDKMYATFLKCFRPILIEAPSENKKDYFEKL